MHPALPASAMHSNGIPITQTLQIYKKVFETTIVFEKKCIDIQSMSKKYQVVYLEGILYFYVKTLAENLKKVYICTV